jgi:parallel beta-helix repeat protein
MNITARSGDKTLHLFFKTTAEPYLSVLGIYPASRLCCGAGAIHTVGVIEGYYTDCSQNISLQGNCSVGPFRQYPTTRFVSLEVTRIRSPQASGFSIEIVSNLVGARLYIERLRYPHHQLNVSLELNRPLSPEKPPVQPYDGAILFVGGSGPGNHTHIQDAVNLAHDGDTVFVYGGDYHENVFIDKAIRLVGENTSKVLLNGGTRSAIKVVANNVEITGFTINAEQVNSYNDAGIYVASCGNHIHDNQLIKSEWYGITIFNSSYNVIENNSLIDNDIGIWLCQARDNFVRGNTISDSDYVGIWLWPFSIHNTISYNSFVDNKINAKNNDATARNIWSHNYWDDYVGLRWKRVVNLNNDGIGIIPYRISSFNRDFKPLLTPIS